VKPAVGAVAAVSLLMILIVLGTEGLSLGWISSILIADAVLASFLFVMFKIRDYRIAHVPRARAAYEALLARDKARGARSMVPSPRSPESVRVFLTLGTAAPLVPGVLVGLVLGDLAVGIAAGVVMAIAGMSAWAWWLWRPA
jgi:hypothetical protein